MWLWVSAIIILAGAELNSEIEQQAFCPQLPRNEISTRSQLWSTELPLTNTHPFVATRNR
jgi:uncharacterized BrkB/YihY/UPF0761 family membrane protein